VRSAEGIQSAAFGRSAGTKGQVWRSFHNKLGLPCQTAQVSADAKLTHSRYGNNKTTAIRLLCQKDRTVATMRISKSKTPAVDKAP